MTPLRLRVAELRATKGWTQQELADRSGVGRVTITRIESKRNRRIEFETLEKLAIALGVDPGYLILSEPRRKK